jgi:hypothetical protein
MFCWWRRGWNVGAESLGQQSKDFCAVGFDALVERWDKYINVGEGFFPGSNITCFTFDIHLWPIYWLSLIVVILISQFISISYFLMCLLFAAARTFGTNAIHNSISQPTCYSDSVVWSADTFSSSSSSCPRISAPWFWHTFTRTSTYRIVHAPHTPHSRYM